MVVPIQRRHSGPSQTICGRVARQLASAKMPDRFTATVARDVRQGRIYIDYQRNARGATTVAAYSPRARADASVSLPVTWDELGRLSGAAASI